MVGTQRCSQGRPVEERAADLLDQLRPDGAPRTTETSITQNNQSFQTTLMKEAIRESGRDLSDPGSVKQIWFEQEGMLVLVVGGK